MSEPVNIFSEQGQKELRRICAVQPLLAFDFDGTLVELMLDPTKVALKDNVRTLLEHLCKLYCVAVISGRGEADVKQRLPVSIRYIVGNHGAELSTFKDFDAKRSEAVATVASWMKQLESMLPSGSEKIALEDKKLTATLHFARAADIENARRIAETLASKLDPKPHLVGGKDVVNLVPRGLPNKGDALEFLLKKEGCSHAIFVGDDVTDEDVFKRKDLNVLSIFVGENKKTAADYYLKGQAQIADLLAHLVALSPRGPLSSISS